MLQTCILTCGLQILAFKSGADLRAHVYDMFPGLPEVRNGYMYPNDKPGLGIDIDEKLAAKYPCEDFVEEWTQTRLPDGSPARP